MKSGQDGATLRARGHATDEPQEAEQALLSQTEKELLELQREAERIEEMIGAFRQKTKDVEKIQADAYSSTKDALKKIQNLHKFARTLRDVSKRDAVTHRLKPIEEALQHSSALKFATGSGYIRFMLGHVNVKVFTVTEKNMLRDEYNKFRDRTNIIFFVVPIFISVLHNFFQASILQIRWLHVVYYVWLLYYYVTLALRENILFVNGSRIPSWSFTHHYASAIGSVVMLCWPNGPAYQQFYMLLIWYSIFQGAMQFMRSHYQKRRYYTLRSLGQVGSMDVSHEDTIREAPKELILLLPFIFAVQGFQLYLGSRLLYTAFFELNFRQSMKYYQEEMQTALLGCMLLFLGLGNFVATFKALRRKGQKLAAHRRMKKHSSSNSSTTTTTTQPVQR